MRLFWLSYVTLPLTTASPISFTVSGGGLKSVTIGAALTSVLLAKNSEEDNSTSSLADSGIYDNVDTIGGISGGTWFWGNMAYSESFVGLVEDMAVLVNTAPDDTLKDDIRDLFNDVYTKVFLDAAASNTGQGMPIASKFADLLDFFKIGNDLAVFFDFMSALYESDDTVDFARWHDMMKYVLMADVPQDATFSFPPQEWAVGKTTIVPVAASAPVEDDTGTSERENVWFNLNMTKSKYLGYTATFRDTTVNEKYPHFPVRFSYVLGSDDTAAPLPFTAPLFQEFIVEYSGKTCDTSTDETRCATPPEGRTYGGNFEGSIIATDISYADIPISGPIAASSAAPACYTTALPILKALDTLNFDPSVKFSSVLTGSDSFDVPAQLSEQLWTEDTFTGWDMRKFEDYGIYTFVDGGIGDYNGIGAILVSGATEIFVLTNQMENFICHFHGANCWDDEIVNWNYPLFVESEEYAKKKVKKFDELVIPDSAEILFYAGYGSIEATTHESDLFGIEGHREVTLHILAFEGDITAFEFEDFRNYGTYASDIVATLTHPSNSDILDEISEVFVSTSVNDDQKSLQKAFAFDKVVH